MDALVAIAVVVIVGIIGLYYVGHRRAVAAKALKDSRSRARRWVERLGGQVYSLEPKDDPAARQALADAAERFTAAGAQVEQASVPGAVPACRADRSRRSLLRSGGACLAGTRSWAGAARAPRRSCRPAL